MSLKPLSPVGGVNATVIVSLVLASSIFLFGLVAPRWRGELAIAGTVQVLVYGGASLWLLRGLGGGRLLLVGLGLRRISLAILACSVLLGVALQGPAGLLEWLGRLAFPMDDSLLRARADRLLPESPSQRVVVALLVVVFGPFVEELFFRGALHSRLALAARESLVLSVTTLCFTISHPEPRLWPALASVGLALGMVRALTGGIFACFLLHAAFNATTLAVAFRDPSNLDALQVPNPIVVLAGSALSAMLLLWIARLSQSRLRGPT